MLRGAARLFVVAVAAAIAALTLAQRSGTGAWWVELSRYVPHYWVLLPCLAAFIVACGLGRRWALASLVAPALVLTVTMGWQWNRGEAGERRVRLMTYNVKLSGESESSPSTLGVGLEVARHDPDILVMQDAVGLRAPFGGRSRPGLPPLFGLSHVHAAGQYVVASRLPVRGCTSGPLAGPPEGIGYLRCSFDAHGTALTVVNVHFKSPRGGLSATRQEGVEGAADWRDNVDERLAQSRELARRLAAMPRPLVVAGDLNAPESSPVVRQLLATGLRDSFSAAGRGYGFSYGQSMRAGLSFLRIDHVLVSADLGVSRSVVGGGEASEHRPVIADLVLPH